MSYSKLFKNDKGVLLSLIILLVIALGLLIAASFLVWQLEQVQIGSSQPSAPERNLQIPNGPIYGIWGIITSFATASVSVGPGLYSHEEGVVKLKSDYDKDYEFKVNDDTIIKEYSVSQKTSTPVIRDYLTWDELKEGDRVYFTSPEDLLTVFNPNVESLEVYIYE